MERDLSCVLDHHGPPQGQPFPNTVEALTAFLGLRASHALFLGVPLFIFTSHPLLPSGLADRELVSDQHLGEASFVCVLSCVQGSQYVAMLVCNSWLLIKKSPISIWPVL